MTDTFVLYEICWENLWQRPLDGQENLSLVHHNILALRMAKG